MGHYTFEKQVTDWGKMNKFRRNKYMQTKKPTGLAKLWREIKRPFGQLKCWYRWSLLGHDELVRSVQWSISTAVLHQKTFTPFKNIHHGQEIVLVAIGPSAKDYKRIDGAIHIGVNRAFQIENINLRYLFMQDYGVKPYLKEANQYNPESCTKFYGLLEWEPTIIPESDAIEANALRYTTDCKQFYKRWRFSYAIDSEPLGDFRSIVFPAMQFALWTNPRTIYLVGCDCSEGYFDGQVGTTRGSRFIRPWIHLKEFAQIHYPEIEIKSINPVGLKGVFNEHKQT